MLFRRVPRIIARRILYPGVEALNRRLLLFRHRRTQAGNIARAIRFEGGQRILILAAHPDDETIGCLGAIHGHTTDGDHVRVLIITDGSGSRAGGLQPRAMAEQRRTEVDSLRRLLTAVEIIECGLTEGHWDEPDLSSIVAEALNWQPAVIYAPSCVDFHPEHLKVARVLGKLAAASHIQAVIRCYEMQVPLGPELLNAYVPLDERATSVKVGAVNTYRSQKEALQLWKREARYVAALVGVGGLAEGFWEMDLPAYASVMTYGKWGWPDTPFRSLNGRPLRDLEAYIRGSAVRRRLREIGGIASQPS